MRRLRAAFAGHLSRSVERVFVAVSRVERFHLHAGDAAKDGAGVALSALLCAIRFGGEVPIGEGGGERAIRAVEHAIRFGEGAEVVGGK